MYDNMTLDNSDESWSVAKQVQRLTLTLFCYEDLIYN